MTLRNKLIKLAHAKPELREHLLPLIKEAKRNQYEVSVWAWEGTGQMDTDFFSEHQYANSLYDVFDSIDSLNIGDFSHRFEGDSPLKMRNWRWDNSEKAFKASGQDTGFSVEQVRVVEYNGFYEEVDEEVYTEFDYYIEIKKDGKPLDKHEAGMALKALKSGKYKWLPKV